MPLFQGHPDAMVQAGFVGTGWLWDGKIGRHALPFLMYPLITLDGRVLVAPQAVNDRGRDTSAVASSNPVAVTTTFCSAWASRLLIQTGGDSKVHAVRVLAEVHLDVGGFQGNAWPTLSVCRNRHKKNPLAAKTKGFMAVVKKFSTR